MSSDREQALEAAILDIDAHATPLGTDEDGFVSVGYAVSVGAMHRALGLIGHTNAPCRLCKGDEHECATTLLVARVADHYVRSALETIAGAMGLPLVDRDESDRPLANFQLVESIVGWVALHRTTCHPQESPSEVPS